MLNLGVRRTAVGLVVVLLAIAAVALPATAATLPAGFREAPISRPDGRPWDQAEGLVAAPDGRMFVWERKGRVWVVGATPASTSPALDLSDDVSTIGNLGLKGFALDPQFEQNGHVYVFYAVEPLALAECSAPLRGRASCKPIYSAGTHATFGATIGRLVRYTMVKLAGAHDFSDAIAVDPASRVVLLGETPANGGAPQGCLVTESGHGPGSLVFGSDGTLLAGCGDGASTVADDVGSLTETSFREALDRGLMSRNENVGAFRAQMVNSLSGKILRLNAASGDGVASNPFFDSSAPRAARSRVWALGLHDPQRFTVRAASGSSVAADARPGTLFIGDLGYTTWEALEVTASPGTNFGWPIYEGAANEKTPYARLAVFNLDAPTDIGGAVCRQPYYRFSDLLSDDSLHTAEWRNPCAANTRAPLALDMFMRSRPAIDWLHNGLHARWAAFDSSGNALALTLGTAAPNGATVSGSLFGGTASIGGVWYDGGDFPAEFRRVYFHADAGGQWVKAISVDRNDNPLAVHDFLSNGGAIRALATNAARGGLYYISGPTGSDVDRIAYDATTAALAAALPAPAPVSSPAATTLDATHTPANASAPSSSAPRSATNSGGRAGSTAARAAVVRATTASTLPSPWTSGDIGSVAAAGSASYNNGVYSVAGSGADIWFSYDAFQYVSQPFIGNGTITARVVSQTNSNGWAKAGVMIRETLTSNATFASVLVTPSQGIVYQGRSSTAASALSNQVNTAVTLPYWVRVTRVGSTFTGYISADGITWTATGTYTISMASQVYFGLAVTSHQDGTLSTVVFDNVSLIALSTAPAAPSVPTGLAAPGVSSTSVSLSWTASSNNSPSGVGGYYIYRNGNTTTPIATVSSGTTYTDTTVMAATTYTYQVAAFDTTTPTSNVSAPTAAITVTTPPTGSTGTLPLTGGDIGTVAAAGSSAAASGIYTVSGSGSDIWYSADAFQFDAETLSGNGTITARVVSQSNSNSWAKAGVMFRETRGVNSTFAAVEVTPSSGTVYQGRSSTGAQATSYQLSSTVTLPYWVRVTRVGTTFSGYTSPDGVNWTSAGTYTISMAAQVYVGLAVTSHQDGTLSTAVFDNVSITSLSTAPAAPSVPTGLAAPSVSSTSISLSWTASTNNSPSGVGGYYVYRNGNTSTPLATVTSGTTYTDASVVASTAYTYQVAALDTTMPTPNVSAPSAAISVTTPAAGSITTLPLTGADIGSVAAGGSSSAAAGVYTVKGSGADIYYAGDAFQFDSEPFTGNGTITARVVSQTNSSAWAKAGVMIRESLAASASFAAVEVTPSQGAVYQARTSTGAQAVSAQLSSAVTLPYWVRVTRNGTTFTGYTSPDGNTWTLSGAYTIAMAAQVYIGLAVTSHQDGTLSTVVFDNVTVAATSTAPTAPSVPAGLAAPGVSSTSVALNWTASFNTSMSGVGGDYVYRNGNTTTPLATVTTGTTYTDPTVAASSTYTYQVASFDTTTPTPNVSAPSAAISVTTPAAGSITTLPLTGADVGTVAAGGSSAGAAGVYTVKGSGADIWFSYDGFQFDSEQFSGNGTITARVVSQTNTNAWAKAGVMFRETLASNATFASVLVTPSQGIVYQGRTTTSTSAVSNQVSTAVTLPYWVRVTRAGTTFTGYTSADGNSWSTTGSYTIAMASQVYVGLAVTSHQDGTLSTVVFDSVTISNTSTASAPTIPTGLATLSDAYNSVALSWNASTNASQSGVGGYYIYRNGNTTTPIATVTNGSTYTDGTVATSTSYSYQVAAFDTSTPTPLVSAPTAAISVTTPPLPTVTISPRQASLTYSQTQQFTATAQSGNSVLWTVDGVPSGNSTVGTISTTGLYTPPATPGTHTVVATDSLLPANSGNVTVAVTDITGVFTYHDDVARTGQNLHEYLLTPAKVAAGTFGKRWSCTVDGGVYAQPLYVANLRIGGGVHNVLIVATMHDTVYAFDADSAACVVYWQTAYINNATNVSSTSAAGCSDVLTEYGITGTPVIDPVAQTLYLVTNTTESGVVTFRLRAVNLLTGTERTASTVIAATVPGTGDGGSTVTFNPAMQHQRLALTLTAGGVFVGFGSHCDIAPWHGWLMRFDATTLAQTAVFNSTPNGTAGGIWSSGGGPAVDSSGSLYLTTGNGTFDDVNSIVPPAAPGNDFGESYVSLNPATLAVRDFYTPSQTQLWSNADEDLASSGVTVLPDGAGPAAHPNVLVGSDKLGHLWMIDRSNMSHFSSSADNTVQFLTLPNTTTCGGGSAGTGECVFSTQGYWNGNIYVATKSGPLMQLPLSGGLLPGNAQQIAVPASQSIEFYGYPTPTPMISASPTGNGVVWVLDNNANGTTNGSVAQGAAVLRAYNATSLGSTLYTSSASGADVGPPAVKFTVPVIANGRVYVAGGQQVTAYGLAP